MLPEESPDQEERPALLDVPVYWARKDGADLINELHERADQYYEFVQSTGRLALWRRALRQFRGYDPDGGYLNSKAVTFDGEQGELVRLQTNHFAGMIQGVHTLVTGTKPTTRAIAAMGTSDSQEDAAVADKILEWDISQKRVGETLAQAALVAMHSGEGWVYQAWDAMQGDIIGQRPDGGFLYSGDTHTQYMHPLDVIRDPYARLEGDQPMEWIMVRRKVNRATLMQQFPDHAESIDQERLSTDSVKQDRALFGYESKHRTKQDYVYLFEFYHDRTPALPGGRVVWFIGDAKLIDGPLPYAELPVHPIYPDTDDEVAFGFTPMWHLLAPQAAYDSIISAAQTNIDAGGINNFWLPTGEAVEVEDIAGGMNLIKSAVKPEVIEFARVSDDALKVAELHEKNMEKLSGMNSVTRGEPDANLKSGAALALVQSMSVQHNSGHQRGYAGLIERVYSARVRIWQRFVTQERVAEIAGEDERVNAQRWTGESMQGVTRIKVELSNPMMSTTQGRTELADKLLAAGFITRPEEYLGVIATGRLEPVLKAPREQLRLIARENDRLRKQEPVKAIAIVDNHELHIHEHATLLTDPAIRFDDAKAEAVLMHIQEHMDLSAPQPMPGDAPANDNGAPPEEEQSAKPPVPANDNGAPSEVTGQSADLPNMPTNPATGEQAKVSGGFQ